MPCCMDQLERIADISDAQIIHDEFIVSPDLETFQHLVLP